MYHFCQKGYFHGNRQFLWGGLLLAAIVSILPTSSAVAALPVTISQVPISIETPLDQNLSRLLTQVQSLKNLSQQRINTLLGPIQEDLSVAIQQAFGPLTLDVHDAQQKILQSINSGTVYSTTGINPVLERYPTAARALTEYHQTAVLSQAAQDEHLKMLEATQHTLEQIKQCGETGRSAQSTQDAVKAFLCQSSGMAAIDAMLIPLLRKNLETNVGIETHLSLLNEQLHGQYLAETQTRMSEAAHSRLVRASFSSLLLSPSHTSGMTTQP